MLKNLFLSLPENILNNVNYLQSDYVGLKLDTSVIFNLLFGFGIAISLTLVSYLLGMKIRRLLIKKRILNNNFLLDVGIGYILIGTGITVIGMISLLNSFVISAYLILVSAFSLLPVSNSILNLKELFKFLKKTIKETKKNKFVFIWLSLFIFLAVIKLLNPEIREDQYHVDFPRMYLNEHTIIVPPKEQFHVSASPLLSEMYYTIGIFLWSNESARYIHFIFYILVLLTLFEFSKLQKYKFSIYTPLLFATAPVVIHETSSMYVDFQWIFYALISVLVLTLNNKLTNTAILASGFFLGAMVSSKLWTIVFIPAETLYLIFLLKESIYKEKFKKILLFLFISAIIPMIWFVRAFILTGNPFYPAFISDVSLENVRTNLDLLHYVGINSTLLNPISLINVFSPLFFIGILFLLYDIKKNIKLLLTLDLSKYVFLIFILYLFIQYTWGRYLMGLYIMLIFFSSLGIFNVLKNFKYSKHFLNVLLFVLFFYYFINSILILPYSLGFADKNKYLTRILSRDNSSYYDFDKQFDKYISKDDFVATYGIYGYRYANFRYIDINYIFNKNNLSFNEFKKKGITKIFIKGGDMDYFCSNINLRNCELSKYSYLSSYFGTQPYYLYNIK